MNCLSFTLLVGILLGTILNCYGQSDIIQQKTKDEAQKQIIKDNPIVNFDSTSSRGGSSGIDITPYKGNNPFSNQIFDRIWQGYDVNSDSKNGFSDMKKRVSFVSFKIFIILIVHARIQ